MNSLQTYGSSSETDSESEAESAEKKAEMDLHLKPVDPSVSIAKTLAVVAAPDVIPLVRVTISSLYAQHKNVHYYCFRVLVM